jgi:hypothetical protein
VHDGNGSQVGQARLDDLPKIPASAAGKLIDSLVKKDQRKPPGAPAARVRLALR